MKYTDEQIKGGLDKLPLTQKKILLESLKKEKEYFKNNFSWLNFSELRRCELITRQIKFLEEELK